MPVTVKHADIFQRAFVSIWLETGPPTSLHLQQSKECPKSYSKKCFSILDSTHNRHVVPSVVVYLTFTLMYGGIITHSFITCKLHLKLSGKVNPASVVNNTSKALREVDDKIFTIFNDFLHQLLLKEAAHICWTSNSNMLILLFRFKFIFDILILITVQLLFM